MTALQAILAALSAVGFAVLFALGLGRAAASGDSLLHPRRNRMFVCPKGVVHGPKISD